MKKEKVALFGGSFNPPHIGHSMVITYALSQHVDRVFVVPTYRHAFGKDLAPFKHRLKMAHLAFGWMNVGRICAKVVVTNVEEHLGKSRTLDTIERLYELNPDMDLRLLVGSDIMHEKDQWHRFDEIEKLAPPIVIGRQGHTHCGAITMPNVSSTYCRAMFEYGEHDTLPGLTELLHPKVREYIEEHQLYRKKKWD
jgi:nicotinate-nucleotide adenylyltransferase